jgi:hypothetical protein
MVAMVLWLWDLERENVQCIFTDCDAIRGIKIEMHYLQYLFSLKVIQIYNPIYNQQISQSPVNNSNSIVSCQGLSNRPAVNIISSPAGIFQGHHRHH